MGGRGSGKKSVQNHALPHFALLRPLPQQVQAKLRKHFLFLKSEAAQESKSLESVPSLVCDVLLAIRLQAISSLTAFALFWRTGEVSGNLLLEALYILCFTLVDGHCATFRVYSCWNVQIHLTWTRQVQSPPPHPPQFSYHRSGLLQVRF